MILNILPRRDVEHAVRVFLGEICKHVHLLWIHAAKRNLDALHARSVPKRVGPLRQIGRVVQFLRADSVMPVPVVVALAITSPSQSCLGENLLVELALLAQGDFGRKLVDFIGKLRIQAVH